MDAAMPAAKPDRPLPTKLIFVPSKRSERSEAVGHRLFATERDIPQQKIKLVDRPADVFPGSLLNLVLPVGINAPALDAPSPPPLFVFVRRIREWFAQQLLDPFETKRHLFLPTRQAIQKVAQRVVLCHL